MEGAREGTADLSPLSLSPLGLSALLGAPLPFPLPGPEPGISNSGANRGDSIWTDANRHFAAGVKMKRVSA